MSPRIPASIIVFALLAMFVLGQPATAQVASMPSTMVSGRYEFGGQANAWPDATTNPANNLYGGRPINRFTSRIEPSNGPISSPYPSSKYPEATYPGQLVSHPGSSINMLQAPGENSMFDMPEQECASDMPRDSRPGVFQKVVFDGTWIGTGGLDELGISSLELSSVFAFPCPTRESPLVITPGFGVHYLDGPGGVRDLPPQLYEAYTQFRWMHRFGPRWATDIAVTPGIYSDFEQSSDDGIRVTGHGVGVWTCNPDLKLVLGVAYLDREDVGIIPAGGIVWTPSEDLRFELVSPRPRIAKRLYFTFDDDIEDWVYIAGEFGGGTWAISRNSGVRDVVTYRDFRFIMGAQRKVIGGIDYRVEAGYIFSRKLEYVSATPDLNPSDTFMLRAGMTY